MSKVKVSLNLTVMAGRSSKHSTKKKKKKEPTMNCRSSVDFPQSVKRQKVVKDVDERFTKLKMTSANVLICPQPNNISREV